MKKLLFVNILLLWVLGIKSQSTLDTRTLNSSSGLNLVEYACESFIIGHGFQFSASTNKGLKLAINSSACSPLKEILTKISNGENYILTLTPLDEIQSLSLDNGIITIDRTLVQEPRYRTEIQYFDGLGRPTQRVSRNITPSGKDLVSLQEYDAFGRESRSWLPASNAGDGAFVPNASIVIQSYYGDSAYSHPVYEASPLNRVLEQYGPGQKWRVEHKSVKSEFLTNDSSLPCYLFKIDEYTGIKKDGVYDDSELLVTKTTDENDAVSYEFKDKLGQVILTRQITTQTIRGQIRITNHDTYYIYDNFGNLCYVLPPLLSDKFSANTKMATDVDVDMKAYGYIYKYNDRNLCIEKRLPGCDPIHYVYDKADRVILSQDGEQRLLKNWAFTKYDVFGRVILTGIQNINKTREQLSTSYKNVFISEKPGGVAYGYSWNTMPDVTYEGVLTVNYYDNYNHLLDQGFRNELSYSSDKENQGFGKCFIGELQQNSAKGLLTGTRVKLLNDPSKEIVTSFFYDERGRVIQTKRKNHLGQIEKEYTSYNFADQPIKILKESPLIMTLQISENDRYIEDLSQLDELYEYTYDDASRLKSVIRNGVKVVDNTYNELGQLVNLNQASLLHTSYTYNIRGWTKTLNEAHTGFRQTLYYEDGADKVNYNGNISRMQYNYNGQRPMDFAYTYDGLSRLRNAMTLINGKETSEDVYYDKHGNATGITRIQEGKYTGYLMTTHSGNQATYVYDDISSIVPGIIQYTGIGEEAHFAYNTNGALTKDSGRGIITIKYNSLNLPEVIQFSNGNITLYTYAADGTKLKTKHLTAKVGVVQPITDGEIKELKTSDILSTLTTDYVGNIIYENDQPEGMKIPSIRVLFDGGYDLYQTSMGMTELTHKSSFYYLKDYLGNNRSLVSKNGVIAPHVEYLPFGTPLKSGGDRFKYSDKEFDEMHGLNMYDFHARQYDPLFVRFTSIDPLAEKYYSISPYAYCNNNPLRYIDPTGMDWVETTGDQVIFYAGDYGDTREILHIFKASSGRENVMFTDGSTANGQVASAQKYKNYGPTVEGKYKLDLSLDPERKAQLKKGEVVRGEGIESLEGMTDPDEPGKTFAAPNWGKRRVRMIPINVKQPDESRPRDLNSFYFHDSEKGYSAGCTEVESGFFDVLMKAREEGETSILVRVRYPSPNHKTNGGTKK